MKKLIVLFVLLAFWIASPVWAVTYTIGPGQTYTTFTLLVATETLDDDDIVDGGGNTFTETWTPDGSGTNGHNIILRNAVIDATGLDYGVNLYIQDYITVTDIEVTGALSAGIRLRRANNCLVTLCSVHDMGTPNEAYPSEGIQVDSGSNNTVSYNTIYEIGRHGIDVAAFNTFAASNNIVEHNTIYNCYHSGIDSNNVGDAGVAVLSGNIFRYNHIYATPAYSNFALPMVGIYMEGSGATLVNDGAQIYYNVIHDLPGKGIQAYFYITNAVIYNNTIANKNASYSSDAPGLEIDDTGSSGIVVKNNIVSGYENAGTTAAVILSATASPAANVNYNMWWVHGSPHKVVAAGGADYHWDDQALYVAAGFDVNAPTWADPLFVSATNFSLQSGSPCRDAGVDVGLTQDYLGVAVPQGTYPDIGAYEYNTMPPTGFKITGGKM